MTIWNDLPTAGYAVMRVPVGDVQTRVLRAGSGPDVICLHGTSGHLEAFTRNVRPLVEAGYTVHAIDMLGHGYTDKPVFDYVPPVHAEHLARYIDENTAGRVHLIGESLGGWVSAWLASERPELVDRVVLVAPGGSAATPEVMERIKISTQAAVAAADTTLTRERLELLMFDPTIVPDELVEVRRRIYAQEDFRRALPHILCLQEMDTRNKYLLDEPMLAKIEAPTLLIWGRQNPFGKMNEADFLSNAIPDCRLEVFDECGHWPQYEKHDEFNRLVTEFLGQG